MDINKFTLQKSITARLSKFLIAVIILVQNLTVASPINVPGSSNNKTINFTIVVLDKNTAIPIQSVVVIIKKGNSIVAQSSSNPFGRAIFTDLQENNYTLLTHYIGYADFETSIAVDSTHLLYEIKLSEKAVELNEVLIESHRENKASTIIDVSTGRQTFEGETYHSSPISGMTNLIQQNLAGASKAPTGEVHIRGQHGEFTYLIDGIPVPLGVFGGLNEIVDPKIISRVTFYTAGFPAEFGGQIAGIMDIENKVPTGALHLDLSTFAGSYLTSSSENLGDRVGSLKNINSNGQSLSFSDHLGKLGYFFSGTRQESDRRIDQPVTKLSHNHGFDYFSYGKFDYLLNENNYLTMNLNYSKTATQVPFDSSQGYIQDNQNSYNGFQTISYFHTISSEADREENLFIGGFLREGNLYYTPGIDDKQNRVFLNNDTTVSYVIKQKRSFATYGVKAKYDHSISHNFKYAAGLTFSITEGNEDFRFLNYTGEKQKNISNFSGNDFGVFVQTQWHPLEWTRFDAGIRYDLHSAPSLAKQYQFSPRLKWHCLIDESNSISLSYDKIYMPTNIENLGAIASLLGAKGAPNKPEKDNLYELAFMRNWDIGLNTKLAGFYKESSPGLDDQTLGSSTIRVNININRVIVRGLEFAATYTNQDSPFSGYLNSSIIHAFGTGPVSGGFIPADSSTNPFDLDHDQRLSCVVGLNFQPSDYYINFSANYVSGLINGSENFTYKTGLFDLNQGGHTSPSWIFNISAGYKFNVSGTNTLEPSVYITNLLDHGHLIKGAFFSGASFEERRNVVLKIAYHI